MPSELKRQRSQSPVGPLSSSELALCQSVMDAIYTEKDNSRRKICDDFRVLPSREDFPDYYDVVHEPMALDDIQERLEGAEFNSVDAMVQDLHLCFHNAMSYNEDGSGIFEDAQRLDALVSRLYPTSSDHSFSRSDNSFASPSQDLSSAPSPSANGGEQVLYPPKKKRGRPSKADLAARAAWEAANPGVALTTPKPTRPKPPPPPVSTAPSSAAQTPPPPVPSPMYAPPPQPSFMRLDSSQSTPHTSMVPLPMPSSPQPGGMGPGLSSLSAGVGAGGGGGAGGYQMSEVSSDNDEEVIESRNMISALEDSLERMPPLDDQGWVSSEMSVSSMASIVENIKTFKNSHGYRLAEVLERLPEITDNNLLSFNWPHSLALIEHQVVNSSYQYPADFDRDMTRLFEKARRYYQDGTADYGNVLVLQRLYQGLTNYPFRLTTTAATHFASTIAGPARAKMVKVTDEESRADPLAFTVGRINTKDKDLMETTWYKGISYTVGEYVHLMNPDEPWRPTVGQVYKIYRNEKGDRAGQLNLSVCWYFRPEQIIHPANRMFYENEVFKTGHFVEHHFEDVIEKIGCQFFTKAVRGRPRPPFWYPGWPLYVVDSRWNEKDQVLVRIKNWASCIPEELRKTDFMPIVPFPSQIRLRRQISPFLRGIEGPGGIGEFGTLGGGGGVGGGGGGGEDDDDGGADTPAGSGSGGTAVTELGVITMSPSGIPTHKDGKKLRKREVERLQRKLAKEAVKAASPQPSGTPLTRPNQPRLGALSGSPSIPGSPSPHYGGVGTPAAPRMMGSAQGYVPSPGGAVPRPGYPPPLGGMSLGPSNLSRPPLGPSQSMPYAVGGMQPGLVQQPVPGHQPPMMQQQQQQPLHQFSQQQQQLLQQRRTVDRSVMGNSGGAAWANQVAQHDTIGEETVRRFDRDSANKILWFSTPPVVYPTTTRPRPSVKYLTFRAKQVTTGALETDEGEERPLDPELKGALESLVDGRLGAMTAFGKEFDDRSGSALFEDVQRLLAESAFDG